jgi:Protein of unknown function (DUF2652)
MENRGLIFIPDISGFTQFVSTIELQHSQHVIQELLELLIDSNELDLKISEIEGDAILFYKFGDVPDLTSLYQQVEKMFINFHLRLEKFESERTCNCNACINAINLSLKIITHYGEFTRYKVKSFCKLIGKDVIVAHQLLKNDISTHEYWLITENVFRGDLLPELTKGMTWLKNVRQTEAGELTFLYTLLSELKSNTNSQQSSCR